MLKQDKKLKPVFLEVPTPSKRFLLLERAKAEETIPYLVSAEKRGKKVKPQPSTEAAWGVDDEFIISDLNPDKS